ncbi:activity-regulated cytoskeleton associated protein 1-like [Belonocnema kinseyi]|uniref:activity-regulated cytoskeleton associated protein 1-like n=1 Tax=Belonocnema kinseyi TaxID=2817044 RepID=UPI00143D37AA|nr:activity-regulated cytoskeleton associated protein 1-like [Belonocnema kinseyi]
MAITFTPEQFQEFLQNIKASLRFEGAQPAAQPSAAAPHQGNFSKCVSRFDGSKDTDVNAFIDAIQIYKECTNISDENALKGIPMLLNGFAATGWKGVKSSVNT